MPINIFPLIRALVITFVCGCLFFSVRNMRILSNNHTVAVVGCPSAVKAGTLS